MLARLLDPLASRLYDSRAAQEVRKSQENQIIFETFNGGTY